MSDPLSVCEQEKNTALTPPNADVLILNYDPNPEHVPLDTKYKVMAFGLS